MYKYVFKIILTTLLLCSATANAALIDGFETGDFSANSWTTSGDENWFVTSALAASGTYSAESGNIAANETSRLDLNLTTDSGDITFDVLTSTEGNQDILSFYIDGVFQAQWSGTTGWTSVSFAVAAGTHTFSWIYDKDGSVSSFRDAVNIDNIRVPVPVSATPVPTMPTYGLALIMLGLLFVAVRRLRGTAKR